MFHCTPCCDRNKDRADLLKNGVGWSYRPFHRSCEATSRRAPPAARRTATSRTVSSSSDGRALPLRRAVGRRDGDPRSGRSFTCKPSPQSSDSSCAIDTSPACVVIATRRWPARKTRVGIAEPGGPLRTSPGPPCTRSPERTPTRRSCRPSAGSMRAAVSNERCDRARVRLPSR